MSAVGCRPRITALVLTSLAQLGLAALGHAQSLGTYSWQLQPYCNRVTLSVPQMGGPIDVASPKVKPVDTVGAGDCFNGALAAELAREPGRYEPAMRFAVAAAALSVTRHGAQASMPRRNEILKLLKQVKSFR